MTKISKVWKKTKGTTRVSQLLILISFLITFIIVRLTIQTLTVFNLPYPNVINGLHVHHLVPGIFLIMLSGYIGISFWRNQKLRWLMAIFFGSGVALTIDEFALWLHLKDVYWQNEGRISIDAVIIIFVIFLITFLLSERHDHSELKRFYKKIFVKQKRI